MNDLQIFSNSEFGDVGVLVIEGREYFPATHCASVLGYNNPHKAVRDHCKGVTIRSVPTNGGIQPVNYITESDLFRLITNSKLPAAEKFESWIFEEVLPTIRKHGAYLTPEKIEEALTDPDVIIKLATQLKQERESRKALENTVKQLEPKAEFFDQVADSKDAIQIGDAAKVLNCGIGRNKLFAQLRDEKVLMSNNIPYQQYIDRGYFRTIEQKWVTPDGETRISIKTLVYQKGLDFIRRLLMDKQPATT